MIIWDLQYSYEGYMALDLAQYEDFFSLLVVTFMAQEGLWFVWSWPAKRVHFGFFVYC